MGQSSVPMPLVACLQEFLDRPGGRFYAPGHQGQLPPVLSQLWGDRLALTDLPELPEVGSLFAKTGAIAGAQVLAAQAFGADRTWFLVNGSSVGILAAIGACCRPGEKILLPRNVHRSAIAGVLLSGARPVYLTPPQARGWDFALNITADQIAQGLAEHPDCRAVAIVSPTYQGICADLGAIAQVVHDRGLPLVVDEAHGAHLTCHGDFPPCALASGADLVVQSSHKTLGALTQAAMVHGQGNRLDWQRFSLLLQSLQTTSPSALLLASLDACRAQMVQEGGQRWGALLQRAQHLREQLAPLPAITLLPDPIAGQRCDPSRLTLGLQHCAWDGYTVDSWLQAQGSTVELPQGHSLSLILTPHLTAEKGDRLAAVLGQLPPGENPPPPPLPYPAIACPHLTPAEVHQGQTLALPLDRTVGQISAELICPYPPGIPLLLPGEVITAEALALIQQLQEQGAEITGMGDPQSQTLRVRV